MSSLGIDSGLVSVITVDFIFSTSSSVMKSFVGSTPGSSDMDILTYESKYGKKITEFEPLEWMAALVSHIPDRGTQTVHYYGRYNNATRERLKKEEDGPEFHIIEDDETSKGLNRSWARLIQKIYEVDPLLCSRCGKKMKIISHYIRIIGG